MPTVVPADGALLQRLVAATPLVAHCGLSRDAFMKFDAAQAKTAWAVKRRRRFVLVEGNDVLATVFSIDHDDATNHGVDLVERLLEAATRDGADLALIVSARGADDARAWWRRP